MEHDKIRRRELINATYSSLRAISPLIDEYAEWYGDVLRCFFYAEEDLPPLDNNVDALFSEWRRDIENLEFVDQEAIQRLSSLQAEMRETALSLCAAAAEGRGKPDITNFEKFSNLFYSFISNLRRLEKDSVLEDSGIDVLTGLRSKKAMHGDIDKELERLTRRGKPFCLSLARIDNYENIIAEHGREHARGFTKVVAGYIKKSVRSFDDAYRLGAGEFLLCLKQADITGGIAALERLRRMLEASGTTYRLGGQDVLLTMSCCIAEPVHDDEVDDLIQHLRDDLSAVEKSSGAVLEYHEMSDLQRYIQGSS